MDPFAAIASSLVNVHRAPDLRLFCFVALGDSFTAGRDCPAGERWADRVAASLAVRSPLAYHNLAADGATSREVLAQSAEAVQLEPDLVTVICGANDVLASVRPDVDGYAFRFASILDRLRGALPRVAILTATSPEGWRFLDLRRRTRRRVIAGIRSLNDATREIARQRGVPCVDVANHPGLSRRENFAPDGLHPSPLGHARAAAELARALRSSFGIDVATTRKEQR